MEYLEHRFIHFSEYVDNQMKLVLDAIKSCDPRTNPEEWKLYWKLAHSYKEYKERNEKS